MKRSEINYIIQDAVTFLKEVKFKLPPFAFWGVSDWLTKGEEYNEIRDNLLGWDITDFGSGFFRDLGVLLFTLRNGNPSLEQYEKPYAEKILILEEAQVVPFHFHFRKIEDIINRGGGNLLISVYDSTDKGEKSLSPVTISIDGQVLEVEAGEVIKITGGESITIERNQYHSFWVEEGTGKVLLGEVSSVNDDLHDNRFYEDRGRFPIIKEDCEPQYLLCTDIRKLKASP